MRDVAIVGVGSHPWGVFPDKSMPEMAVEAISEALEDATMDWGDIEAVVSGAYLWNAQHEGLFAILSGAPIVAQMGPTGVPIVNCTNASATGQTLLREAYLAVASGAHDIALAVATDKSSGGLFGPLSDDARFDEDFIRFVTTGAINPTYWAIECKRRMHEAGTTDEDLALAKVVTGIGGSRNPRARYQREFTIDEVMSSPMVSEPLRLLEICATSDGAAAVILASPEVAERLAGPTVWIDSIALASRQFGDPSLRTPTLGAYARPDVPDLSEARRCMTQLYADAGLAPDDLDLIELPDNSSWHYLTYLDIVLDLPPGTAERLLREGATDPFSGSVPVCPGGGASASGEAVLAQGLLQVREVVLQLRGQAGERQVPGELEHGLAMSYGYLGNNAGCVLSVRG